MTRTEARDYLPDVYAFFSNCGEKHPFWRAVSAVSVREVQRGRTLLPVLDRICSSLSFIEGHQAVKQDCEEITTHQELMTFFTQLYIAYLYREHGPRLIHGDHGYHIEVEIADQLLALGVVGFHDFSSPVIQFSDRIHNTLEYLEQLKTASRAFTQHPTARHHVIASVTDHSQLHREVELAKEVSQQPAEMAQRFPHLSGIILVDPTPGRERAKFIPFHGENHTLEQLLDKSN